MQTAHGGVKIPFRRRDKLPRYSVVTIKQKARAYGVNLLCYPQKPKISVTVMG